MNRRMILTGLVALPLTLAGWAYARTLAQDQRDQPQQIEADTYTCPVTGEELPCPNCCPLNQSK
jgi:hypothetical protein